MKDKGSSDKLRERAYHYIKGKIMVGKLVSGSVVSEESLAREIGISRTPVREAIRRLALEGVMQQLPRYGTIVKEMSLKDIMEINELREALEPYAIRKSVENLTDSDIVFLEDLCSEILGFINKLKENGQACLNESDQRRFLVIDLGFHMTIIRAAHNRRIMDALINARSLATLFGVMNEITVAKLENTYHRHFTIVSALKDRDADKAEKAMHEHLAASMKPAKEQYAKMKELERAYRGNKEENALSLNEILNTCGITDSYGSGVVGAAL